MNIKQRRKYEMLLRVRDFGVMHQQLFSKSAVGQQAFAAIGGAIDELATSDVTKMSTSLARRAEGTRAARWALRQLLRDVSRLARVFRAGGVDIGPFELPESRSDHDLRIAGRQFALAAKAHVAEFTGHGLSPSRIARVTTAFETAMRDRGNSYGEHVAARARIQDLLTKACLNVQRLDVLIANGVDADIVVKAVWEQACRIEERKRRRIVDADQTPQTASEVVKFPVAIAV
jgi:hypothetical protein